MVDRLFRVRFLCDVASLPEFSYTAGQEDDVHPDRAVEWIKAGFAELVQEQEPEKKPRLVK